MGYVRTAGMSTAGRRKRRRAGIVLTVLLTLLLVVGIYAFAYYMDLLPRSAPSDEANDTDQVTATADATPTITPAEVTVNVYNASGVSGIAGRTSEALDSYGYQVDSIGDAPDDFETPEVAQIIHGAEGKEGAELLAELVPGAEVIDDDREGEAVDLFVGEGFEEIETARYDTDGEGDGDGD